MNRLYKNGHSSIVLQGVQESPVSPRRVERLLEALFCFFSNKMPYLNYIHSNPAWLKVFVALDTGLFSADNTLHSADYLVQNTWGEVFFRALDVTHIENNLLRCYEIAKQACRYLQKALPGDSEYRIYDSRTINDTTTTKTIEDFIKSFQKSGAEDLKAPGADKPEETAPPRSGRKKRPFLDSL